MTRINILPPLVADMIAAGEVVERPASVIKELTENSFDAGARKVTIEFRNGGATYIKITDDGCGMSPEDAGLAFTRHATSKLHDEKGLEAIGTMGFRGEALAAIAAVSRIELITREKGAPEGVRVTVQAGDIVDMEPCGCPEGTSITVRDIFHNTPARLKFLKSDRAEASACTAAALHCALGRPEISVRLMRDGEEVFFTPGDGREESAVYSLLGRDAARGMLPVSGEHDGMSVDGFTSSPAFGRGNRANQHFYCNGRYIKSVLLQSAVEQAYKNTLLTGRFPSCVLYLKISNGAVDVNVHPAKTEVKFSDEKKVFDLVYQSVRACLEAESRPAEIDLAQPAQRVEPRQDFYKSMSASEYRAAAAKQDAPRRPVFRSEQSYSVPPVERERPKFNNYNNYNNNYSAPTPTPAPAPASTPTPTAENSAAQSMEDIAAPAYRVIGEALDTYILVEMGDELLLIDKHAAHERMIFDELIKSERPIMSQTLLTPVIIRPESEDAELIDSNSALLDEMGFEIEQFGASDYAIRAIPDDIDISEAASAVEEICSKLRANVEISAKDKRDEILHTVACKAAIKAGRRHDISELERIAAAVVSGKVKYCPHGRPVSAALTKKQLDKFFSRIV